MFTDARSKTILFVAHCILNQNSISDGTAAYPGAVKYIIELLLESGIGIMQLPCPELMCLGLDRGDKTGAASPIIEENSRIRTALGQTQADEKLKALIEPLVFQIAEYRKYGFDIRGIVGINRSPSCGVETTSQNNQEIHRPRCFYGSPRPRTRKKRHSSQDGRRQRRRTRKIDSIREALD